MTCPASIHLTDADVAAYAALPNPVYEVSGGHLCVLSLGHDGNHAAEVQSSVFSDRSYWALWDDGSTDYRIMLLTMCLVTRRRADHTTALCLLYDNHGGEHDWIDEQGGPAF